MKIRTDRQTKATRQKIYTTRSISKMLGPFATASRFTLSFTRCRYSPTAATVARRLHIDVHDDDDDDNNDNAWQRGPLWPHGMGPTKQVRTIGSKFVNVATEMWAARQQISQHSVRFTADTVWTSVKSVCRQMHVTLTTCGDVVSRQTDVSKCRSLTVMAAAGVDWTLIACERQQVPLVVLVCWSVTGRQFTATHLQCDHRLWLWLLAADN